MSDDSTNTAEAPQETPAVEAEKAERPKAVVVGKEIWRNTTRARVYYIQTDRHGRETTKFVTGGKEFTISAVDVQIAIDRLSDPKRSPFVNGTLKRVDARVADPEQPEEEQEAQGKTPLPEGHDPATVLEDGDLRKLLAKTGMAFHTAVKKLNEAQARRFLEIVEENEDGNVSVKQAEFVKQYVVDTFRVSRTNTSSQEAVEAQRGTPAGISND